jgi:signal transduction histidine kinase
VPDVPDDKFSFAVWGTATWIVTIATALAVIVQRWNEPNPIRTLALVGIGMLSITFDDLFHARYAWLWPVPQLVWCLPVVAAVFGLVWYPVSSDFAPFLLVLVTARAVVIGKPLDGIVVALASVAAMITVEAAGRFDGAFIWVLGISFGWIGGYATRSMLRLVEELNAAQAGLAEKAAADERQRIAREIHDVIAHSLSVTALHITGARMALRRSPEEATEALLQAEQLARDSLGQVRSVIGMLGSTADGTAPAMPTLLDVPRLVGDFRRAGVEVDLDVDGNIGPFSPAIELVLYRVVQESLSNVVRHAPGASARVAASASDDLVTLTVSNPLPNGAAELGQGRGIQGMRERARAHGGSLVAGVEDGQWRVCLRVPTTAVAP